MRTGGSIALTCSIIREPVATDETARSDSTTGVAIEDGSDGRAVEPADADLKSSPLSTKPDERTNIPSAATSTVGNFFGNDGVFDTMADEMIRASGETAPILSRAAASRYFPR